MTDTNNEWLNTRQVLAWLGISRTRLWQLTRDGLLTSHVRGVDRRARYFRREDVESLAREYRPVNRKLQSDGAER